jgi:hypothetical protein
VVLDRLATTAPSLGVAPRGPARATLSRLFVGRVGVDLACSSLPAAALTRTQLDIGSRPHAGIGRVLLQDAGVLLARTWVIAGLREDARQRARVVTSPGSFATIASARS